MDRIETAGTAPESGVKRAPGKSSGHVDVVVESPIRVGELAALQTAGVMTVRGTNHNIAVFTEGDRVYAVDNRCPHMGFPLDRGSVRDGMLTCH